MLGVPVAAGRFTLKELDALRTVLKNSIDYIISDKPIQVRGLSSSSPVAAGAGHHPRPTTYCHTVAALQIDSPPTWLQEQLDPGNEADAAEVEHAPSQRRLNQDGQPAAALLRAPHRMLPEEFNATWGLDLLDQPGLPLDQVYRYTYNGEAGVLQLWQPCAAAAQALFHVLRCVLVCPCLLYAGSGVHVYVLDTGIRSTHAEFLDAERNTSRVAGGFDAVSASNSTEDCHGHGTHVAAIVGGERRLCPAQTGLSTWPDCACPLPALPLT